MSIANRWVRSGKQVGDDEPRWWASSRIALAMCLCCVGLLPVACRTQSGIETLAPFTVELKWDRPGDMTLDVQAVDATSAGEIVTLSLDPTGSVALQRVARDFAVVPSIARTGASSSGTESVELDQLAQRAIRDHYPELASNAEARLAADSIEVASASIDLDGRNTVARVILAVDPEDPRLEGIARQRLPARVDSVRLIAKGRPGTTILIAVPSDSEGTGGAFEFNLAELGPARCKDLQALLRGEVEVVVEATVERRGREHFVTAALESPIVEEVLRDATRATLNRLGEGGQPSDLRLELAADTGAITHGSRLPGVVLVNAGSRPVATSNLLYQVEYAGGEVVFDEFVSPVDCMCPGERIELPSPDTSTDPCLPSLGGDEGLLYLVKSTRNREIFGLRFPAEGTIPLEARSFGRFELLPIEAGPRTIVEAEDLGGGGATELRLLLRVGDGDALSLPFPDLGPRGRQTVILPDALGPDARDVWARWIEGAASGGPSVVDLELIEAWRSGCDGAVPARQRLRLQ